MSFSNQIKTAMLLTVLSGLLLFVGQLVGGMSGLTLALIIAVTLNMGSYWFSDKMVLWMYRAKEASKKEAPELHRMVEEVANLAGMPTPRVYIFNSPTPNAFATGRNPSHAAVACSTSIMDLLTKDELKGVIAHEISHIRNRDTLIASVAATIAGVISYVATMARWAAMFGGYGGGRDRDNSNLVEMLVLTILLPITATIIQLAISRSREYLADETGARIVKNPAGLASALEKLSQANQMMPFRFGNRAGSSLFIVNPFSGGSFLTMFSTHPPMAERVKRLRAMKNL